MHTYQFITNGRTIRIAANSQWEAKALFQEKFGTWPDDDVITELS